MLIACETCNNQYEADDYDNCPKCGFDNQSQVDDIDEEE